MNIVYRMSLMYMFTFIVFNLHYSFQLRFTSNIMNSAHIFIAALHCSTPSQVLSRVPDLSEYQPSPFVNLESLKLIVYVPPLSRLENPNTPPNHVITYLLSNSPGAKIFIQVFQVSTVKFYMFLHAALIHRDAGACLNPKYGSLFILHKYLVYQLLHANPLHQDSFFN